MQMVSRRLPAKEARARGNHPQAPCGRERKNPAPISRRGAQGHETGTNASYPTMGRSLGSW